MRKFKVGDKVRFIDLNNPNYGCVTTIKQLHGTDGDWEWYEVDGGLKDDMINAPEDDELELYTVPIIAEFTDNKVVTERTITLIKVDNVEVQYTTNTKRNRVYIHGPSAKGSVRVDSIDNLINLLTEIKERVNNA